MMKNKKISTPQKLLRENFKNEQKRKIVYSKVSNVLGKILLYIILYGLAFIILYPLIQQLAVALRRPEDINNATVMWIPIRYSFTNFRLTAIVLDFWPTLLNTFILSFGITVLQLITTALAGYSLARLKFKGRGIITVLVLLTIVISPTMIEIPLKIQFSKMNLLGKPILLYMLAFFGLGIKSGIFILIFRQFFKSLPQEVEEAAYIDGANPFQVFFRVMLPNVKGAILLTGILTFVWQWNDYYYTSNFISRTNYKFETLTTKIMGVSNNIQSAIRDAGVWQLFGEDVSKNPLFLSMVLNTAAMLVMIPLLILYLFFQKALFERGIERTGLVG